MSKKLNQTQPETQNENQKTQSDFSSEDEFEDIKPTKNIPKTKREIAIENLSKRKNKGGRPKKTVIKKVKEDPVEINNELPKDMEEKAIKQEMKQAKEETGDDLAYYDFLQNYLMNKQFNNDDSPKRKRKSTFDEKALEKIIDDRITALTSKIDKIVPVVEDTHKKTMKSYYKLKEPKRLNNDENGDVRIVSRWNALRK